MATLMSDPVVVQRVLDHIDNQTRDMGGQVWREPVENYLSPERFDAEMELLRRYSVPFCPSAALPETGSYVARDAAGTPIIAIRGGDGVVRAFRNGCRHRGMQLTEGSGCRKAFVCRFHGWTYGLDGQLLHVPHDYGFPGLDPAAMGLVELPTAEMLGLVFVNQSGDSAIPPDLEGLAPIVSPSHKLLRATETEIEYNWKLGIENALEGYHTRPLHRDTFYPIQFDNLTVVESFGRNHRITFPYRRINGLREVPPGERRAAGVLTYVYHLFPNVIISTFSTYISVGITEPLGLGRSKGFGWTLSDRPIEENEEQQTKVQRDRDFVTRGGMEDNEAMRAVQRGLRSGANEFFEFARFEHAIGDFHRSLHAALAETGLKA